MVVVVVRLSEEDMREYLSGSRSGLLERGMCMRGVLGIVGGYEDGDGDTDGGWEWWRREGKFFSCCNYCYWRRREMKGAGRLNIH